MSRLVGPGSGSDAARGLGIVVLCFFLSGATGLIYQVVWLRVLGLIFGQTVHAVTAVLAAFMAGLALGSWIFSRFTPRIRDLLAAYGWVEIAIGLYAGVIPWLLALASSVYLGAHQALALSYDEFSLVQFLVVVALLLVPTTLMGGTLPLLSQALAGGATHAGRTVGALYAINTFGAVAGVIAAGYFLLPTLGNRATIFIAAGANLAVGGLALGVSRRSRTRRGDAIASRAAGPPRESAAGAGAADVPDARASWLGVWLTLGALAVSGAASMVYEIAWTRALALVVGSSTYAFTAMLVAVLVGIAGGSALYSWLWGGRRASPVVFAVLQTGIGIAAAGITVTFDRLPDLVFAGLQWSASYGFVQLIQFTVSAGVLLPSTLLIGATFPCAVAVASRGARAIGRDVGVVYAVNTLGAIAGTIAAGFVLIPAVGVQSSIRVAALANLLTAATLVAFAARAPRPAYVGLQSVVMAAALGLGWIAPWDQRAMASGASIYGRSYTERPGAREILSDHRILYYRDGVSANVVVSRAGEYLFLRVNGKVDASTRGDMPTQLLLGHLPLLLHPAPKSVLVIGLGSGITAGAVARHPVDRVDIAEIEPAVVDASRFFAHVHGDVLRDPRVRTVIADARNFLLTTRERYDVIISEPSNPWMGGLAALFSVEFFERARARLEPGGVMMQWLQGYGLSPDDVQMVVRTFRAAFPVTSVWNTRGDFLLLGRTAPTPIDLHHLERRWAAVPGISTDMTRIGIQSWPGILGFAMLGEADAERFSAGRALNTDDRLPLEFTAPRGLYVESAAENRDRMRRFRMAELPAITPESRRALDRPEVRYWIGKGFLGREASAEALTQFERALHLDPAHARAAVGASVASLNLGRTGEALELARKAIAGEPRNAEAQFAAGVAAARLRRPDEALAFLERAVALQPDNAEFQAVLRHTRERQQAW